MISPDPAFSRAHIPLLAPPFGDSDGLQSNACIDSYSYSTSKKNIRSFGLLFSGSGSDYFPYLDGPITPAVDPLLDSPQLTATDSPAEPFCLDPYSLSESYSCPGDQPGTLDASSSTFSIRDWMIQPPSSPVPSDSLSRSPMPSPLARRVDSTHRASSTPTIPHVDVNLLDLVSTVPGTPESINPAVLAVSLAPSLSLTNSDGAHESVERGFLQVAEHLYLSRIPPAGSLSPGGTSVPGRDRTSTCAPQVPNAQTLGVMYSESDFRERSTPMAAQFTGSTLMSPRDPVYSNNNVTVTPETPMFNMHQGINEYDLQRRANRYRRRYPGKSLDHHWLSRYAGKLNKDGKAIEQYRCYISGCAQINKRRDHIIVHICSHVNERPFACRHW